MVFFVDRRRHSCFSLLSLRFSLLVFVPVPLLINHTTMYFFFFSRSIWNHRSTLVASSKSKTHCFLTWKLEKNTNLRTRTEDCKDEVNLGLGLTLINQGRKDQRTARQPAGSVYNTDRRWLPELEGDLARAPVASRLGDWAEERRRVASGLRCDSRKEKLVRCFAKPAGSSCVTKPYGLTFVWKITRKNKWVGAKSMGLVGARPYTMGLVLGHVQWCYLRSTM